jgi:tetratricopeptide (TPR) repeat protein
VRGVVAAVVCLAAIGAVAASNAPVPAGTGDVGQAFAAANAAYHESRYADAVAGYEALLRAGFGSAPVQYNYGNALYRLERPGAAVLAYRRALRLAPSDADIRENLAFVTSRLLDRRDDSSEGPLAALLDWHRRLSPDGMTIGFLSLWAAFMLALGSALAPGGRWRRMSLTLLPVFLAGVLIAALLLGGTVYRREFVVEGVFIAPRADILSEPGGGLTLTTVHEGMTVEVLERREEWLRVLLPNGIQGWAGAASLGIVDGP